MPDNDVFKLGNFSGLPGKDDGSNDIDNISAGNGPIAVEPLAGENNGIASPPDADRNDEKEVIRHPIVKSDPQAKFRSPRDGQPLLEIDLEKIIPNEFQPRRIFNPEKLQELADSIREHGVIQPIVVVERPDGAYEVVVGERRLRASKLAGLAKIPAFVHAPLQAEEKLELALIENVQRADLNPIEEGRAYQRLIDEFNLGINEIGERVGKNRSTIANLTRLLKLPVEVQKSLIDGTITEGQARPLLALRSSEEMLAMFKIVMGDQMKSRDVERRVQEIKKRRMKVTDMFTPDPLISTMENMLRSKLGTKVEVNKSAKGGKITIEFYSDDELNDIIHKIV
ncbi:ParB/RepB/Spo0J family partition protein [bacterium]|nr:MAG: ParB/RepB/Spo0J family partition protein [bacterium]